MKCFEYEYTVRLEEKGSNDALTGIRIGIGTFFMVIVNVLLKKSKPNGI